MIFGGIEHRVWAFLRNEGDFDTAQTADAIADFVRDALAPSSPASEDPGGDRPVPDRIRRRSNGKFCWQELCPASAPERSLSAAEISGPRNGPGLAPQLRAASHVQRVSPVT